MAFLRARVLMVSQLFTALQWQPAPDVARAVPPGIVL